MVKCSACGVEQEPGTNCISCGSPLNLEYPEQNQSTKKSTKSNETKIWERFLLAPFRENIREDIQQNDYNIETTVAFIFVFLLSLAIPLPYTSLGSFYTGSIPIYGATILGVLPLIILTIITAGLIYIIGTSLKRTITFSQTFRVFVYIAISTMLILVVYVGIIRNFPALFFSTFFAEFFFTIVPLIIVSGFITSGIRTLFKTQYILAFLLSIVIIFIENLILPLIFFLI